MTIALLGSVLKRGHSESTWLEMVDKLEKSHNAIDDIVTQATVRKEELNYHQASFNATMELRFL